MRLPWIMTGAPAFPEKREINREMLKIFGHLGASQRFWRSFALRFQSIADNSLLHIEQGILLSGTGNLPPK
jgi:hypothetical protein